MKEKRRHFINICIALFFAVFVIAPVMSMLCRITPAGIRQMAGNPQFFQAIWNSVMVALAAAMITIIISLLAAWCLERIQIKLKTLFEMVFILPMLIPSISHALGLVALFGNNGLITNLLHLKISIYGFWGMVAASVMYSFPVSFLMFSGILKYEDGLAYKAAEVLGVPVLRRFTDITLPYMKKTIISAFFAVFTMVITDYGVPLMIRGKMITLSVLMYDKAVSMMDYDAGSVTGAILLIPAVIAFFVDLLNPENGQGSFVSEPVASKKRTIFSVTAFAFCAVISICIFAPIISFCVIVFETKYPVNPTFTLYHIQKTIGRGADQYLLNSVLYSFLTAMLGTAIAFACAYMTSRIKGTFSRGLHLLSITSMAIPGIVLGLSYVIFFHNSPLYGTIWIIVFVNAIHFFSSPYLMMYNTLGKINPNIEAVGKCLGISRICVIKDIIFPKVRGTMWEMFAYFFVNSMMTISAVSFLVPPAPKPVALMINQFESQLLMESAAFVALLILAVNVILKLIIALFNNILHPHLEK